MAVSLNYLRNLWRLLEMPLINCKVELELKLTRYCVLSVAGNENNINEDANTNNFIFTIKDTKLYFLVVTLSAKDNQKFLSQGFQKSLYRNEYKTKSDNKNMTNEFRCFLESNFVVVNRLFVLVYTNEANNAKRFNAKKILLTKRYNKKV